MGLPRDLAAMDSERGVVSGRADVRRSGYRLYDRPSGAGDQWRVRRPVLHRCLLACYLGGAARRGSVRADRQLDIYYRHDCSWVRIARVAGVLDLYGTRTRLAAY